MEANHITIIEDVCIALDPYFEKKKLF